MWKYSPHYLLRDLEVLVVRMDGRRVGVTGVDDERDARGEEGDGGLDVGDREVTHASA